MEDEGWIENTGVKPECGPDRLVDIKLSDGNSYYSDDGDWDWDLYIDFCIVCWRYSASDGKEQLLDKFKAAFGTLPPEQPVRNKYMREIKPDVWVDVYEVLRAFNVTDSALAHLVKKALAAGQRGHKDAHEDYKDILASAKRALELYEEWNK